MPIDNASSKTMHGARAKLNISDSSPGAVAKPVGIFNNVSWGLTYDAQPVYLLGRMSPEELVYTAQEPVSVTASGFRVVGAGPHKAANMPNLKDLLASGYLSLTITDRQTNRTIAKISSVRATSYSTTLSARNLEEITVTFIGLLVDDEDTTNTEDGNSGAIPASRLP